MPPLPEPPGSVHHPPFHPAVARAAVRVDEEHAHAAGRIVDGAPSTSSCRGAQLATGVVDASPVHDRNASLRVATALFWVLILILAGCHRREGVRSPVRRLPPLGQRLLVLAPHPDDEVLGAGGLMLAGRSEGARIAVVVLTDGEAGGRGSVQGEDLAATREEETRRALAHLGPELAVRFLGYADGRLGWAWSEHWTAVRRDGTEESAQTIVDDIRGALRAAAPSAVLLPMPLDEHPDHRALNRLTLLALLGEWREREDPELLAYLIHAGHDWPPGAPSDPCTQRLFPWTRLVLDRVTQEEKSALIRDYGSQLGRRGAILRFARPEEPFVRGQIIRADRPVGRTHPGVDRVPEGVVVRLLRTRCILGADREDRLRLRFFRAGSVEERVIELGSPPTAIGGPAGHPLQPAGDVRIAVTTRAVRLELGGDLPELAGAVLEVLPGNRPGAVAPAWLLIWNARASALPPPSS